MKKMSEIIQANCSWSKTSINGSSRETNKSQINTMMKQRWGLDRNNVLWPTPGDPWGVEQHRWNTWHFCIRKVREIWLLASPILITFVLGTSNKGQGGLVTSFSIIDYLYIGNQQLMQKWSLEQKKTNSWTPVGQATDKKAPVPTN